MSMILSRCSSAIRTPRISATSANDQTRRRRLLGIPRAHNAMLERSSLPKDSSPSQGGVALVEKNRRAMCHLGTFASALTVACLTTTDVAKALSMEHIMEGVPHIILVDLNPGDWFGGFLYSAGQQANEAVQDQLSALSFANLAVIFGAGLVISLSPCTLSVLPLTLGNIGAFGSGKNRANFPSSVQAYLAGLTFALAASPCSTPVFATLLGYVASTRDPVNGDSLLLTYTTGYVAPLLLAAGALQSLLSFCEFSA